ncbi:Uncharacterized conserved protein, DUF305 family [Streptomyces sp. TverLS-915]|uniref:DUF305 domain-containing protein n=1 Tax=unclassified Streptomyces TaxID=2593676 RepID=UPI00081ED001|nr:DUF305 domain-containing protein [Streptomyces sp. TverLS-915]SCD45005.1 Uncharacterized conserved protein, DUF305 family [Streptomyces sp. TverLS-915]
MHQAHHARHAARRLTALALAATAALALAACAAEDGGHAGPRNHGADADPALHNTADSAFARDMIPHHRQALEMTDLAAGRASSPAVRNLATEIAKAQRPEIATLEGWLGSWGEQVPGTMRHSGGHTMAGMMSEADMKGLEKSRGAAFDAAFLRLMTAHHEGAVTMARTESERGANSAAKALARRIVATQNAEIATMRKLSGELK